MPKLLIAFASATLLLAGSGIWKANAATIANAGTLAPLTKSYAPAEKVAYRHRYARRHYRRGYRRGYLWLWLRLSALLRLWLPTPYYGYGYRPYGYYGYGWRPGITIGIGRGWGWRY